MHRDTFGLVHLTMIGRPRAGLRLTALTPSPPPGYDVRYRWYSKVRHARYYSAVLVNCGPTYLGVF